MIIYKPICNVILLHWAKQKYFCTSEVLKVVTFENKESLKTFKRLQMIYVNGLQKHVFRFCCLLIDFFRHNFFLTISNIHFTVCIRDLDLAKGYFWITFDHF